MLLKVGALAAVTVTAAVGTEFLAHNDCRCRYRVSSNVCVQKLLKIRPIAAVNSDRHCRYRSLAAFVHKLREKPPIASMLKTRFLAAFVDKRLEKPLKIGLLAVFFHKRR